MIHKVIAKMPIALVFFWLFSAVFKYEPHFVCFSINDLYRLFILIAFIHFSIFTEKYSEFEKIYVYCIFTVVFLHTIYKLLALLEYMNLYYFINLTFIIYSFWTISKKKN